MSRYEGKPFVRLIECYILSAIDELPAVYEQKLVEMVPALKETYNIEGTWREVVAEVMQFPDSIDEELRGMWNHNQAIAAQKNQILSAEAFAQAVVDQNFPSEPEGEEDEGEEE
ncbi:hypothetical protein LOC68_16620 [Blastopirellula sp. JC732]|uniref:Uncharacterized protein n=1 Tax=Blastopirellula sediminis TaxID=2894196 RepID=A0A9X1MPF7_9BACT|nr:hypothetical protein [Blastopirellula sediminis]MCC9606685.1 hypothetical protein [Blastopirellula sediminis]MCC9630017.1 hypothetical protein [Blastopirellula sediminis]